MRLLVGLVLLAAVFLAAALLFVWLIDRAIVEWFRRRAEHHDRAEARELVAAVEAWRQTFWPEPSTRTVRVIKRGAA